MQQSRDPFPRNCDTARTLRRNATDAERKLWRLLRNRCLAKWRFRRQQPIGPYFADFFCASAKLIIEIDGSQHGDDDHQISDAQRTEWLRSRGYRVLRFWNRDVLKKADSVMDTIFHELEAAAGDVASPLPENRSR
ncbi:MAG TPA: DUF559 domain-containing protein [Rhizomicrobium sp.]